MKIACSACFYAIFRACTVFSLMLRQSEWSARLAKWRVEYFATRNAYRIELALKIHGMRRATDSPISTPWNNVRTSFAILSMFCCAVCLNDRTSASVGYLCFMCAGAGISGNGNANSCLLRSRGFHQAGEGCSCTGRKCRYAGGVCVGSGGSAQSSRHADRHRGTETD